MEALNKSLLCFGYGYCAEALVKQLPRDQWTIRGTSRNPQKIEKLHANKASTRYVFSREQPLPPEAFEGVTHLLTSIGPDEAGDPILDLHREQLANAENLQWIGYLGTTAVYGDQWRRLG